jgi:hypothetical protein
MWLLPWAFNNYPEQVAEIQRRFPDDIVTCPVAGEPLKTQGEAYKAGIFIDEWGCVFRNIQDGVMGEVKEYPVKNWSDMDAIKDPLEALTFDIEEVDAYCQATDKFVMANCCPRPFERMQFLRGTENVMMDLGIEDEHFFKLLNRVHQFYLKEVRKWSQTRVDGVMFMDDWGTQRSLLISPVMWRKYFKPLYQEYIDIIHAAGKKAFMHSDGQIEEILPDLIELGLDAINSQVFCMDMPSLSEKCKGKITFWGELDRQNLLVQGAREDIARAVHQVYDYFYAKGGVIAQMEFGPGAKPENVITALEEWDKLL